MIDIHVKNVYDLSFHHTWKHICRQRSWFKLSETFMMSEIIYLDWSCHENIFAKNPDSDITH